MKSMIGFTYLHRRVSNKTAKSGTTALLYVIQVKRTLVIVTPALVRIRKLVL